MNNINIIGRLTKEPTLAATAGGTNYVRFCLAVKRPQQNGQALTDFIDCIAWKRTAEIITQYCAKGREIAINGRLTTSQYTDNAGNKRKYYEIVVNTLDLIGNNPAQAVADPPAPPEPGTMAAAAPTAPVAPVAPVAVDIMPDDVSNVPLPFEI